MRASGRAWCASASHLTLRESLSPYYRGKEPSAQCSFCILSSSTDCWRDTSWCSRVCTISLTDSSHHNLRLVPTSTELKYYPLPTDETSRQKHLCSSLESPPHGTSSDLAVTKRRPSVELLPRDSWPNQDQSVCFDTTRLSLLRVVVPVQVRLAVGHLQEASAYPQVQRHPSWPYMDSCATE